MSVVWLGHDAVLGRAVAVKLLSGRYAADERSRRRIREEARAAATLSHPNIAQVYDFGEAEAGAEAEAAGDGGPVPYIVMELVPGPTLAERAAEGPLAAEEALRICAEVAAGLAAAHADGLVHRDVKPANVILSPSGAKLVDFGIAAVAGPAALTDTDASGRPVFGTPQYLAPERLAAGPVTAASDVYSLGVMLYKLLTGALPWPDADGAGLFDAHRHRVAAPLPALPGVPPAVAGLCRRCLARHPESRPGAEEVAAVLRAPAAPPRSGLRHTARLVLAAAAGGTAAVVLAWILASAANRATPAEAQPRFADPVASLVVPPPSAGAATSSAAGAPATTATTATTPAGGTTVGGTPPPGGVVPGPTDGATATGTPPPTPAATTGAPPGTFTSAGGSVTAECRDGLAMITASTPTKPYRLDEEHPGPAAAASVRFRHGNDVVTMTVTCAGGTPAVEVD
ncbi:serine/threonine-protein kinase [Dactylosporangium sp. McL0621]|uniref:serine/threonine-protein kinase n=1 Tax=Dactylosporangium sp. McL0621 TaxID=3415678 RepID=UPI003CF1F83C